ncbi:imidazoleglycerol-phosphate dehydratase [Castilleja foliolosa]|uniref:imidazoleglycerol-phosphate dehydratase n=1 Tax=Castilleja foliolosa TaxID=1961234 RepID=A0ABD3EM46_9LAMI
MQLASHGLFGVHVKATGDVHIDDHHTNEDIALAIGTALLQALGDRKGLRICVQRVSEVAFVRCIIPSPRFGA